MSSIRAWCLRFAGLFDKERKDRELSEELESHLQMHIEDKLRSGMDPAEARRTALIKLGGIEASKESYRDRRSLPWLESFLQDVRFGARMLRKSLGFTVVSILTLALGIGINGTAFSLTNGAFFKGFPFDESHLIVYLGSRNIRRLAPNGRVSYPDFRDWRAQAKSFSGLAAARAEPMTLNDGLGTTETHMAAFMTANSFQVIGQKPAIGRDFTSSDEAPGAAPVAIITYGLWERRYGKDPSIIGRTVRINGNATGVIGVMPKGVIFPVSLDLWVPMVPAADSEKRDVRNLIVFGRLAESATLESARAEMTAIALNLQNQYPVTNQGFAPLVLTYNEFINGPRIAIAFTAMLVAAGFVLLIVCANVANLLLARALSRSREISIRVALGGGRWRLVRQLLVESLMLSGAGGILGWLISYGAVKTFDSAAAPIKPSWFDFSLDYRVFAYLVAISIATGLLFGIAPALRLSKPDVNASLRDGGYGTSTGVHRKLLSNVLVITEVALAIVLLTGAGLMARSSFNIYRAPLGVNQSNVLLMRIALPSSEYSRPADQMAFYDRLKMRLASIAGVESVALAWAPPTGGSISFPYEMENAPTDAQRRPALSAEVISPEYFHVMRVGVTDGRPFTEEDGTSGPPVVIVNQSFVGEFWSGVNPLGKRLRLYVAGQPEPWLTVVGVVPNIVQDDVSPRQIDPLIYLPYRQKPLADAYILAQTLVPPGSLKTVFANEIHAADADMPLGELSTLEERLARNYWFMGIFSILFVVFGGIALLLAAVGLYALMANAVSQRTREIGVRMALGATSGKILQLVFLDGIWQWTIGLVLGLAFALALMRALRAILVQVSPADPLTFFTASLVLALAMALGCYIPARRATKVDPMVALRYE
jgi:putative ABC transport system permease protein